MIEISELHWRGGGGILIAKRRQSRETGRKVEQLRFEVKLLFA
jgi:hypothetical protein